MKKLLYILAFCVLFLSGCEKNPSATAPESVFLLDGDETSQGIKCGDDSASFIKAYQNYRIQVAYNDVSSSYTTMDIKKIPYQQNISTIIANFFIDGKPKSEEELCEENNTELSALHTLLSSPDYLRSHDVLYRYLIFTWKNGIITDIASEELNYNETYETPRLD